MSDQDSQIHALMRKRRALKVSKKLRDGGCAYGEKGKSLIGKYKRGGRCPEDEDEKEIRKLGKEQDEQKTEWDGYKDGGPTKKKWIQGAHLKKGAFTAQANKAGKSVHEYAEEEKNAPGKKGKRARLALTFEKMAKK